MLTGSDGMFELEFTVLFDPAAVCCGCGDGAGLAVSRNLSTVFSKLSKSSLVGGGGFFGGGLTSLSTSCFGGSGFGSGGFGFSHHFAITLLENVQGRGRAREHDQLEREER